MATTFQPFVDRENIPHAGLSNTTVKGARGRSFGPAKGLKAQNSVSQTPRRALGDVGNTTASFTGKRQELSSLKPQLKSLGKTPLQKGLTPKPTPLSSQQLNSTVKRKKQAIQILQDSPTLATSTATTIRKELEDLDIERENMFPCKDRESKYEHEVPLYLKTLLKKNIKFEPPYTEPIFYRQRQCSDPSQETVKLDLTPQELPLPLLDCLGFDDNNVMVEPVEETLCDFSELGPVDISLEGLDLP